MQNPLHKYLLNELKQDYLHVLRRSGDTPESSDYQFFADIIENYRLLNNKSTGVRLTYFGEKLMSKHYDKYRYKLNESPNNKVYVMLDKHMEWPYYIGKTYVTFFNRDDAAWFRLNNNDLIQFTEQL